MNNPWEEIDLNMYETHMSLDKLLQLQTLNSITKYQLNDYEHSSVAILGIAGGNGLDCIDITSTKKVYGIDVNSKYLDICKIRYPQLDGVLELMCCELRDIYTILPFADILICNLIVEYLGISSFVKLIKNNRDNVNVISCVIQKNNSNDFVSSSDLTSDFDPILSIHHNIDEDVLQKEFLNAGFICLKKIVYPLPNGKKFIRIDFKK